VAGRNEDVTPGRTTYSNSRNRNRLVLARITLTSTTAVKMAAISVHQHQQQQSSELQSANSTKEIYVDPIRCHSALVGRHKEELVAHWIRPALERRDLPFIVATPSSDRSTPPPEAVNKT
jgi:hypothetical protein